MNLFRSIVCLCIILLTANNSNAQALLPPPFGLKWGENSKKITDWAERHKLDLTLNLYGNQIDKSQVTIKNSTGSLPGDEATSITANFSKGQLYEVILNYDYPQSNYNSVRLKYSEAKRALSAQYGPLKLSSKKRNTSQDDFTTSSTSYHLEPVSGLFLMLSYTEIKDNLRQTQKAKFSIIYHNDNVTPK